MSEESIGGVGITVSGDFSHLEADFAAATSKARQEGDKLAGAIQDAVKAPDASGAVSAVDGVADAATRAVPALQESASALKQFGDAAGSLMQAGVSLTAALTVPIVGLGLAAIKTAGDLEQNTIAFTTMLGSSTKALSHLQELRDFALTTPFQFTDLELASKRMQALGFAAHDVVPSLRSIGDAAAALGMGADGVQRIVTALGQMQAKATVQAEEMRQLAEAGIPAWQLLAKTLNIDVAGAMKLVEERAVSASVAVPALLAGMNERFHGLMAAQAQTLLGQWSNFKDALTFTLTDIGMALAPVAKAMMENILLPALKVAKDFAQWFKELPTPIIAAATAIAAVAAAVGPALVAMAGFGYLISGLATALPVLTAGFTAVSASALVAAPVIAAVGLAIAAIHFSGLDAQVVEFAKTLRDNFSGLVDLLTPIKDAIGSIGRALAAIDSKSLETLKNLAKELVDIIPGFHTLTEAIEKTAKGFSLWDLTPLGLLKDGLALLIPMIERVGGHYQSMSDAMAKGNPVVADNAKRILDLAEAEILATGATSKHAAAVKTTTEEIIQLAHATHDLVDISAIVVSTEQAQANLFTGLTATVLRFSESTRLVGQNLEYAIEKLNKVKQAFDAGTVSVTQMAAAEAAVSKWSEIASKVHADLAKALEAVDKAYDVAGTAAKSMATAIDQTKVSLDSATPAFRNAVAVINEQTAALERLGLLLPTLAPAMSPLNQAMIAFGTGAGKARTEVENLHTPVEQLVGDIGKLVEAAQRSGDWSEVLLDLEAFDKRIQELAKTDLPEAAAQMSHWVQGLINAGAPAELVRGQMDKLGQLVRKMSAEDLPGAAAAWQAYLALLAQVPQTIGDILALQAEQLEGAIAGAERNGQAAGQWIIALQNVRLEQERLKSAADGWGTVYIEVIQDIQAGFVELGRSFADAIVSGKNLAEVLDHVFDNFLKTMLNDVIQQGLKQFESALMGLGRQAAATGAVFGESAEMESARMKAMAADTNAILGPVENLSKGMDGVAKATTSATSSFASFASTLGGVIGLMAAAYAGGKALGEMFNTSFDPGAIADSIALSGVHGGSASYLNSPLLGGSGGAAAQVQQYLGPAGPPSAETLANAIRALTDQIASLQGIQKTLHDSMVAAYSVGNLTLGDKLAAELRIVASAITTEQAILDSINTSTVAGTQAVTLASLTNQQIYGAMQRAADNLDNLRAQQTSLQNQILAAEATGNDKLVTSLTAQLGTVNSSITSQAALLSQITSAVQNVSPPLVSAFLALQAAFALPDPHGVVDAITGLQVAIAGGDIAAIAAATTILQTAIIEASNSPAMAQALENLQAALASGDTGSIREAMNALQATIISTSGTLEANLAAAEKEVGAAIVSGNASALKQGLSDLAAAFAAIDSAAIAEQITAMDGLTASTEQIAEAIGKQQAALEALIARRDQLNQDLIIAIAAGDDKLVAAIEAQLTTVGGKITATTGVLTQLTGITGTGLGAVVTGVSGVKASVEQMAAAQTNAQSAVDQLRGRLGDLNQQLIIAVAAGDKDLIATINARISATNTALNTANGILAAINAALKEGQEPLSGTTGTQATGSQIADAITRLTNTIAEERAQIADLNQQLIVAVAKGDMERAGRIVTAIQLLNGSIASNTSLLGIVAQSIQNSSGPTAAQYDAAVKAAQADAQRLTDRLLDLHNQLVKAQADNNKDLVAIIQSEISTTNSQLQAANELLKALAPASGDAALDHSGAMWDAAFQLAEIAHQISNNDAQIALALSTNNLAVADQLTASNATLARVAELLQNPPGGNASQAIKDLMAKIVDDDQAMITALFAGDFKTAEQLRQQIEKELAALGVLQMSSASTGTNTGKTADNTAGMKESLQASQAGRAASDREIGTNTGRTADNTAGIKTSMEASQADRQAIRDNTGRGADVLGRVHPAVVDAGAAVVGALAALQSGLTSSFSSVGTRISDSITSGLAALGSLISGLLVPSFGLGGMVPRDMLAQLHSGEFVMTATEVQDLANTGLVLSANAPPVPGWTPVGTAPSGPSPIGTPIGSPTQPGTPMNPGSPPFPPATGPVAVADPAVVAALQALQVALGTGNRTAIEAAVAALQGTLQGTSTTLADRLTAAQAAVAAAIISGNTDAVTKAMADLAAAWAAIDAAATAAQIEAMDGLTASADQIAAAIARERAVLEAAQARQAQLNQDLIIAISAGDTALIAAIQAQLSSVGSQISATTGVLAQLSAITGSGVQAIAIGFSGLMASAAQIAQAQQNAQASVDQLRIRLADLNQQLIVAVAAGNTTLVTAINAQIGTTNTELNTANALLSSINSALPLTGQSPLSGTTGTVATAVTLAAAIAALNNLISTERAQVADLNQQLIAAIAAGDMVLVGRIVAAIGSLNGQISSNTALLGTISGTLSGTPTAAQAAAAVANARADVQRLEARLASLNSQVVIAMAANNLTLVAVLQGEIGATNSQLNTANQLLTSLTVGINALPAAIAAAVQGGGAGPPLNATQQQQLGDALAWTAAAQAAAVAAGTPTDQAAHDAAIAAATLANDAAHGSLPIPSFGLGGYVPRDMIASLHAGEEVLPPDLAGMLRRMAAAPEIAYSYPNYGGNSSSQSVTIHAPIAVYGAANPQDTAQQIAIYLRQASSKFAVSR